jgi:hypothetical protein
MEHHLQVGLLACRPDDLTYPTDHADERAAEAKFLTALPRHEPGWLLLTEGSCTSLPTRLQPPSLRCVSAIASDHWDIAWRTLCSSRRYETVDFFASAILISRSETITRIRKVRVRHVGTESGSVGTIWEQ